MAQKVSLGKLMAMTGLIAGMALAPLAHATAYRLEINSIANLEEQLLQEHQLHPEIFPAACLDPVERWIVLDIDDNTLAEDELAEKVKNWTFDAQIKVPEFLDFHGVCLATDGLKNSPRKIYPLSSSIVSLGQKWLDEKQKIVHLTARSALLEQLSSVQLESAGLLRTPSFLEERLRSVFPLLYPDRNQDLANLSKELELPIEVYLHQSLASMQDHIGVYVSKLAKDKLIDLKRQKLLRLPLRFYAFPPEQLQNKVTANAAFQAKLGPQSALVYHLEFSKTEEELSTPNLNLVALNGNVISGNKNNKGTLLMNSLFILKPSERPKCVIFVDDSNRNIANVLEAAVPDHYFKAISSQSAPADWEIFLKDQFIVAVHNKNSKIIEEVLKSSQVKARPLQ